MTQALPGGRQKAGKYEVVEKIGEGGYSCVYRGFDPLIKRHVAIKSCPSADRETRERFYREAEIAGNLDHPNIVRVYDLFIEKETPYLVQEMLDGEDLDERIERRENTSFSERLDYLIQIARGLEYAHARGVIHRDIKPANIRVLDDGTVKILDFGIAKLVHYNSNLTQKGMAVGTAAYLAPEQIRGEKASAATDIFSFGVLAYELLTYVRPFGRETISETFYQTLNHDPPPLTAHWVDCPPELVAVVSRCLHKDSAERFVSCSDLLCRLEEVRDHLRSDWSPEPNPNKTQALPAGVDLALRTPTPMPTVGQTVRTPVGTAVADDPAPHVDLPLRTRPRGISMAGTARRRPSRAWIPLSVLLAAVIAAWVLVPRDLVISRLEGWLSGSGPTAEGGGPEPAEAAIGATSEPVTPPPQERSAPSEPEPADEPLPAAPERLEEPVPAAVTVPEPESTVVTEPGPAAALTAESASLSFEGVWTSRIQLSVDGGEPVTLGRARVVSVEPGRHSLTFSLEGEHYRASHSLSIQVASGESKRIPVPIDPPGRLTVQAHLGSPQGLVRIGSQRLLRPTPLRGQPLKPGKHHLAIFSHQDRTAPLFESVVDIRSGHEAIVTFDLEGSRQPHVREKRRRR